MSAVGKNTVHESARLHVTGRALYVDDLPAPAGLLHGVAVVSPHAHARILHRDGAEARTMPGVRAVLFSSDVPGHNLIGPIVQDEPLMAEHDVRCVGQIVAVVFAETRAQARVAAGHVAVTYEVLPAVLTIDDAVAQGRFHTAPHVIARGDVTAALNAAHTVVSGAVANGGQDHFYLETQCAVAIPGESAPGEGATMHVYSSTQHPSEIQHMCAHVLGVPSHAVVCEVPRMGGGFGGKESQATQWAALAVLGAAATGRPTKVWLDREQDMLQTGNRHPFQSTYRAGFDADGRLVALEAELYADGGWTADLSTAILDRALFHLDNAYYLPALRFSGRVCATNLPSNTAFRGFGGPQGMLVVEDAINQYAEITGMDPARVRVQSFYGDAPRNVAPYGFVVPAPPLDRIWQELSRDADYDARRAEIDRFNEASVWRKRGIGFQPLKFGISFTNSILNQAGALVLIYADGSVQLNHGGTEMGQGLHTKMIAVCADALGVPVARVRAMRTRTDKVPNTSATAASSGSDLNGQAVRDACDQLRERMRPVAADLLGAAPGDVSFADGSVSAGGKSVPFDEVATTCWLRQVSLHAAGFYRTPGIAYDHATGSGRPFFYYAYGGAIVEVEVNGLTGEHRVRRADILHDVGDALIPSVDRGQVEGAFVQGLGWLTTEEVTYDDEGKLLTRGASTYKVPAMGDVPQDLRVRLLERATQDGTIHGSKAVGEPPFMHAIAAVTALRHAIGAFGQGPVALSLPATGEAILRAVQSRRAG